MMVGQLSYPKFTQLFSFFDISLFEIHSFDFRLVSIKLYD